MILRGQGDSPVRICDPCKKLEDAARFELRYGKNRAAKGKFLILLLCSGQVLSSINILKINVKNYVSLIMSISFYLHDILSHSFIVSPWLPTT